MCWYWSSQIPRGAFSLFPGEALGTVLGGDYSNARGRANGPLL